MTKVDGVKYEPQISIVELRAKNDKMTQKEFGEKIGVSPQTVSSWEKNIYSIRPKHLVRICQEFKVTSEELLGI
ncbi:transcriptional regulator [Dolosigranulum pigrum]|jgi:putative cro-like regulatory protein|uniref:Transcriptional regulator n=1 Tax=Dolosigranulum pigrum TaxID=29394 RepID=A0A328KMQ8_9LACT|nr:helix-turn-helix transcriptional regulator [Dolosigranulum pigrum]QDO91978.1 helix-turn-helix transcriptional regulator [Dolosigranulum pigrum]QJS95924.1 helix-turn-helix transcriptional regulator [Dolosigranulum pigrum]QTJ40347.1 helix-turn-helix transcriptional regulator [Dolosigranulum pigrum]QTJ44930.1 helix-turn-helix transcriptional regulator [Dolosigranulum pigrum]QTJ48831.1 helix-turn-helix transcriptional regulator [Dolosigranulum pigrum]